MVSAWIQLSIDTRNTALFWAILPPVMLSGLMSVLGVSGPMWINSQMLGGSMAVNSHRSCNLGINFQGTVWRRGKWWSGMILDPTHSWSFLSKLQSDLPPSLQNMVGFQTMVAYGLTGLLYKQKSYIKSNHWPIYLSFVCSPSIQDFRQKELFCNICCLKIFGQIPGLRERQALYHWPSLSPPHCMACSHMAAVNSLLQLNLEVPQGSCMDPDHHAGEEGCSSHTGPLSSAWNSPGGHCLSHWGGCMTSEYLQVHLPDKANNASLGLFQVGKIAWWGRNEPIIPIPSPLSWPEWAPFRCKFSCPRNTVPRGAH